MRVDCKCGVKVNGINETTKKTKLWEDNCKIAVKCLNQSTKMACVCVCLCAFYSRAFLCVDLIIWNSSSCLCFKSGIVSMWKIWYRFQATSSVVKYNDAFQLSTQLRTIFMDTIILERPQIEMRESERMREKREIENRIIILTVTLEQSSGEL